MVDAVVVGAGPNGLMAAITLASAGRSVLVVEASDTVGGGARSAELTLPGFVHDICSAVYPLAVAAPAFAALPLDRFDLRFIEPEVQLAHPLDGGRAGIVYREIERTAVGLGVDGDAWRRHVGYLAGRWNDLAPMLLRPLPQIPRHPALLAHFGLHALMPSTRLGKRWFTDAAARALLGGCSAHGMVPLSSPMTSSIGLVLLASAHAAGWPIAEGGSQRISDALAAYLLECGGRIETGQPISSLHQLPPSRAVLFDLAPSQVARIAEDQLPDAYVRRLCRFRSGPAAFKIDYALDGPVPWTNEEARLAGTLHVAGDETEVAIAEADVAAGRHPKRPFVLVAQQSVLDPSRAPAGQHTLWAYCHVPNGSTLDMTAAIESQIERFAPGFRDLILARHVAGPAWFEQHNASYIGGDIAGGATDGLQLLARPVLGRAYTTPNRRLLICSASTPPGAGVHGMCGLNAANAALRGPLR